jgi:hypothetical protein
MTSLSLNSATLDRYFEQLRSLDTYSKKKLIKRLQASLLEKKEPVDLGTLFGAWEDNKDSDEIIKEIMESRVEKEDSIGF